MVVVKAKPKYGQSQKKHKERSEPKRGKLCSQRQARENEHKSRLAWLLLFNWLKTHRAPAFSDWLV